MAAIRRPPFCKCWLASSTINLTDIWSRETVGSSSSHRGRFDMESRDNPRRLFCPCER